MGFTSKHENETERLLSSDQPKRPRYSIPIAELPGEWTDKTVRVNKRALRLFQQAADRLGAHHATYDAAWSPSEINLHAGISSHLHDELIAKTEKFAMSFAASSKYRLRFQDLATRMRNGSWGSAAEN